MKLQAIQVCRKNKRLEEVFYNQFYKNNTETMQHLVII